MVSVGLTSMLCISTSSVCKTEHINWFSALFTFSMIMMAIYLYYDNSAIESVHAFLESIPLVTISKSISHLL